MVARILKTSVIVLVAFAAIHVWYIRGGGIWKSKFTSRHQLEGYVNSRRFLSRTKFHREVWKETKLEYSLFATKGEKLRAKELQSRRSSWIVETTDVRCCCSEMKWNSTYAACCEFYVIYKRYSICGFHFINFSFESISYFRFICKIISVALNNPITKLNFKSNSM